MQFIDSIEIFSKVLDEVRMGKESVGLVPTMGFLHDGHSSLIKRAARENDQVAVSVFVNPLQFGPLEDFDSYPRDLDRDVEIATTSGADIVFAPQISEMYPNFPNEVPTLVRVKGISEVLDGASRPGHFDGVATVVAKLFAFSGRCRAYFGEKDFQQLAIINQLVYDLSFPIEVIGCETVREHDLLAFSSRNVRLTREERVNSTGLFQCLTYGKNLIEEGETNPRIVELKMSEFFFDRSSAQLDYVACVEPTNLLAPRVIDNEMRILIAAKYSSARLIDNIKAVPLNVNNDLGADLGRIRVKNENM